MSSRLTPAPSTADGVRTPPTPGELRADIWLAAALFVGAVLSAALGSTAGFYSGDSPDLAWALLFAAGLTAPLAVRRRYPEVAAIAVTLAFFVGVTARIPELYVSNIAMFIAVYTVGAWVDDRRRAMWVRAAIIVGMFVWLLVTTFQSAIAPDDDGPSRAGMFSPFVAVMLIQFLVNAAFFGGAYYMGDRAYDAAIQTQRLEQRTRELERERERTAAQAVALDRVHIARELHDVVAHHVSSMGVQAGAARTVMEKDPGAARAALLQIERSARESLDELRHLLETLRSPLDDTPDASTARLDGIAELAEHATANGLTTVFTVVGDEVEVSEIVQVAAYRIAQEALTNARRHAGADATADVRLRFTGEVIELEVSNTGRISPPATAGLGTVGMRERAAAVGGSVEIGPRPRGGYLVRARLPLSVPVLA
ncbi:histidine kinase [Microbacterium awajiense]|uniref:histidine kinase n=1 Tax=Microbacterium awajiense TaxID=415214 RepID=A0ABP7AS24_9MICO